MSKFIFIVGMYALMFGIAGFEVRHRLKKEEKKKKDKK